MILSTKQLFVVLTAALAGLIAVAAAWADDVPFLIIGAGWIVSIAMIAVLLRSQINSRS